MSVLQFTDGVEIDTSGEYRTLQLDDGWYVVGHGILQPCANQLEARCIRDELGGQSQAPIGPKFPDVHVQLSGEDGNVFSIIGRVRRALQQAGATADEIRTLTDEVTASGSYDEALRTVMPGLQRPEFCRG